MEYLKKWGHFNESNINMSEDTTLLKKFMDNEYGNDGFVLDDSWESLMSIAKNILYYQQTYHYDNEALLSNGKCPFRLVEEALMSMDIVEFKNAIVEAVKWYVSYKEKR